jgi:hypothetical protein
VLPTIQEMQEIFHIYVGVVQALSFGVQKRFASC